MSYDATQLTVKRNIVRLKIGDNIPTSELLVDSEVNYALTEAADNVLLACKLCCEMIAGKMARMKEKVTEEDLTVVDKRFAYWIELAEKFQKEYANTDEGKAATAAIVKKSRTVDVTYIRGL